MKWKQNSFIIGGFVLITSFLIGIAPYFKTPLKDIYRSSSAVYAEGGELLRLTLSNDHKYRLWVSLSDISPQIKESFIVSEDTYFFNHFGLNPWSLIRAAWTTYFLKGRRSGASTISMQLARMIERIDSSTPVGKLLQLFYAVKMEVLYSKEEILEAYLNLVPMGGNIEGVGAASLIFFNKSASAIKWNEAFILAVIPQNPNKRTLLKGYNDEVKNARERLFLRASHLIPLEERRLSDIDLEPLGIKKLPFFAPHFVREALNRSPGRVILQTTLDLSMQKIFELKIEQYLESHKSKGVRNVSAVLMNWQNSRVVSWVGSADYFDQEIQGQVDGVTSVRSPGSTLKPFIYALGIEEGLIHPGSILKDTPRSFGSYYPENFDGEFKGPVSVEEALNQSRNIPAVDLITKLKEKSFYQFLIDADVGIPKSHEHYGHSLALGGFELSLLELVELYTMLPGSGFKKKATILEHESQRSVPKKILSKEASFLVLDMLSRAELQSRRFRKLPRLNTLPVSWKTGTSSGFKDAWTIGVFGPYVLGIWMGNFSGEGNRSFIGRTLAAPLFFDLIDSVRLHKELDPWMSTAWNTPHTVREVEICPTSGMLPGPNCSHKSKIHFIPGTSPIDKCDVHRLIWVSKKDGKMSCRPDPIKDVSLVHEFWPTDFLEVFNQAGLARKLPPEAGSTCDSLSAMNNARGGLPEIISPKEDIVYSLRSHQHSSSLIPLEANYDSSSKEVYWFIDEEYVGKSQGSSALYWQARNGKFQVKVVDDLGRSSSRKLVVHFID